MEMGTGMVERKWE